MRYGPRVKLSPTASTESMPRTARRTADAMKHGGVRRRRDAERGVSAVEFAMLTPLLFFFLFATVQFG
ncbi:MAG: TadE/TadG family type IV pilus assembly protein, partial [Actinocrinis sp.]